MGEMVTLALALKAEGATKVTVSPDGSLTVEWGRQTTPVPAPKPRIGGEPVEAEPEDWRFLAST